MDDQLRSNMDWGCVLASRRALPTTGIAAMVGPRRRTEGEPARCSEQSVLRPAACPHGSPARELVLRRRGRSRAGAAAREEEGGGAQSSRSSASRARPLLRCEREGPATRHGSEEGGAGRTEKLKIGPA